MTTKSEGMMMPGKLRWYVILALALWLAFSGVAAAEQLYVNESGWWRDGGAFNASGAPIQAAADNATVGDSVFVWNGRYTENVDIVTAHLTLAGEGADVVTVTAANSSDHVFEVAADYVNISGFTVTGATENETAGILLIGANRCNISENNASNNEVGIILFFSSNNTLTSNTALNNDFGILLENSSYCSVENNTANNNTGFEGEETGPPPSTGVIILGSHNIIRQNDASNNFIGIAVLSGGPTDEIISVNNTIEGNTANSNTRSHGIWLWESCDNTVTDNTANFNNEGGICLEVSSSNTLASNTASNNGWGIHLYFSCDNNVTCNLVQNNTNYGIYLTSGSTGNNITCNNIVANGELQTDGSYHCQFNNSQSDDVDAINNFWGAGMNNITIDTSIYDGEEGGWGEVEFYPFETEPVPCAPAPEEPPAFTTTDAVIALQIAVGSRPPDLRWDVSGDGSVTSLDALMILQAAAGSIEIG